MATTESKEFDPEKELDKFVASHPWVQSLEKDQNADKIVTGVTQRLLNMKWFHETMALMGLPKQEGDSLNLPLIGEDKEILLSILVQNG